MHRASTAELRVAYDATRWARKGIGFDAACASPDLRAVLEALARWKSIQLAAPPRTPQLRLPLSK